ncbi:erythromycin esterase family protein [Ekhidna sp.]|uniref:erythromycin esterase family protein n=1 Tax=Ekhidna sp. TaxID=2608089 RepID=UPI003CCBE9B5
MRHLTVTFIILKSFFAFTQDFSNLPVHSIEEKADFSFFEPILKDKRVVLLGEMTHGDGAAFRLKTDLVKYLHKELGYNVLALEDGMYSFLKWSEKMDKGQAEFEDILKSMPYQWSNSFEMQELFSYLKENPDLVFIGCDNIDDYQYLDVFLSEVDSLAKALQIPVYESFDQDLAFLLKYRASKPIEDENKEALLTYLSRMSLELQAKKPSIRNTFWIRVLDGLKVHASEWWDVTTHTKPDWFDYRVHDSTMALNIQWLMNERYKNEKIIVWAANMHIARNVPTKVKSHKYFKNENTVVVGDYLEDLIGDDFFSVATISYSGKYLHNADYHIQTIKEKSKRTLEYHLAKSHEKAFVDFSNHRNLGTFKMSGVLHYLELKGEWTNVYDGVLFIKEMTPATYPER